MATTVVLDDAGTPRRLAGAVHLGARTERLVLGSAFIILVLAVWWLVTALGLEPPILLPSPAAVVAAFGNVFASSDIWADFAASGLELGYGFALAAIVGITEIGRAHV